MNVGMMQPGFMPWQGLFELIYKSDIFIFLDDFQFSVQSYDQRNKMFVSKGKDGWYTVPVKKLISFKAPLNETMIDEASGWREKMWRRIEANYSKAQFFDFMSPIIKKWLFTEEESLSGQNIVFIKLACDLFGFKREFRYSSDYAIKSRRSKRVLELLDACGAKRYFCARGSISYMLEDKVFPVAGMDVRFQNFSPAEYKQIGATDGFVPFLSVADALMNIGPDAVSGLIKNGTKKWLTWEDAASNA